MFLQKAEIQAFSLMVDYQPRSLNATALISSSFTEVLKLMLMNPTIKAADGLLTHLVLSCRQCHVSPKGGDSGL